ncbi:MAG: hypothetical protein J6D26_02135 [Clostridia bacterium]|nr:hypothetical protein [Clostridia bacterium]
MKDKELAKLIIIVGLVLLGFLYPTLMEESLKEILWHGEDYDALVWATIGVIPFAIAGSMTTKFIEKFGSRKTTLKYLTLAFALTGASYMGIAIINVVKSYGYLGEYAIEKGGLSAVAPVSSVILIASILFIIYVFVSDFLPNLSKITSFEKDAETITPPSVKKTSLGNSSTGRLRSTMRTVSSTSSETAERFNGFNSDREL